MTEIRVLTQELARGLSKFKPATIKKAELERITKRLNRNLPAEYWFTTEEMNKILGGYEVD